MSSKIYVIRFFNYELVPFIEMALRELEKKIGDGSRTVNVKYIILVFFLTKYDSRMPEYL